MSQSTGYDVDSAALQRFATALDSAADRVVLIRRRAAGLGLDSGAFGKLAESDGLKADYDTQTKQADDDLGDVSETLRSVADGLRENAGAYDANEEEQTRVFGGGGV